MRRLLFILSSFLFYHFAWAQGFIGIDVRSAQELVDNPAPDALHIPMGVLNKEIGLKISDKNQAIYVFCEAGGRAGKAKTILNNLGYKNVKNIGSWREWNQLSKK